MSENKETFDERRIKYEMDRQIKYLEIAKKFNNLMLQFKCLYNNPAGYACSLLKTPSVAHVYSVFLDFPHVFSYDQISLNAHTYSDKTIKKALKRLIWAQVIRKQDNMYGLNLNPLEGSPMDPSIESKGERT
ncbi:hypothetical protein KKH23_07620 [Patescibacteria group bacterium]|nr:hypothetical protein [Patescibacteria group bacterium]